ncbi:Succinoglycan biosynthesis protein [Sulfitobacter donghicola DSW-25 = KCTC 12864 = JCM 14565]|nr:thermonuclease family protein [Sulfitobacter donghicola]KIN66964.1 Succinoglycan biosynthesis protein [Sulfitobacter donghicola DSW-25 = KCTC 12864 = JCM 14565]
MAVSLSFCAKQWRMTAFLVLVLVAVGLSGEALRANENENVFAGKISVVDGDTFKIAGRSVRLHAIDAPENDQMCQTEQGVDWACGGWITKVVTDRYEGVQSRCETLDTDRYGRTVARCFALGEDVGAWLVREGMAFAYVKYGDDYAEIEREAAAVDRGLHAARLQSPSEHRRTRIKGRIPPDAKCNIKGNISADGKRIYHVVGQAFYEKTGINTAKGERWFCSTTAAQAAGWRASRR